MSEKVCILGWVGDIGPYADVGAIDGTRCAVEKARAGFMAEEEDGVHE